MIDLVEADERWRSRLGDVAALAQGCFEAARDLEPRLSGQACLLLTDDQTLHGLNRQFRGADKPTNILSFPSDNDDFLGDMAIAFETCDRESAQLGIALRDHLQHLIIHGLLHLLGYDHEHEDDAATMEGLEVRILARLAIANPYEVAQP